MAKIQIAFTHNELLVSQKIFILVSSRKGTHRKSCNLWHATRGGRMWCWCFLLSVFCLNQKCHMVKGNLSLAVFYWVSRFVCLCSCFSSLYNGWYMPIYTPSLRESSPSRHNIFRVLTSRHWFWSSSRTSTLRWQSQPTRKFTNQPLHFKKTKRPQTTARIGVDTGNDIQKTGDIWACES